MSSDSLLSCKQGSAGSSQEGKGTHRQGTLKIHSSGSRLRPQTGNGLHTPFTEWNTRSSKRRHQLNTHKLTATDKTTNGLYSPCELPKTCILFLDDFLHPHWNQAAEMWLLIPASWTKSGPIYHDPLLGLPLRAPDNTVIT